MSILSPTRQALAPRQEARTEVSFRVAPAQKAEVRSLGARLRAALGGVVLLAFLLATFEGFCVTRTCHGAEPEGGTAEVAQWLETSAGPFLHSRAAQSLPKLAPDDVSALVTGTPVPAVEYINGGLENSAYWVAPLRLDSSFVGTIALHWTGDEGEDVVITDSDSFASTLASLAQGERILVEPTLGEDATPAYFLLSAESIVTPLDENARNVTAGPMPLTTFLSAISAATASAAPQERADTTGGSNATKIIVGVVLALLAIGVAVGLSVWYRRDLITSQNLDGDEDVDAMNERASRRHSRRSWIHRRSDGERTLGGGADKVTIVDKPKRRPADGRAAEPAIEPVTAESEPSEGEAEKEQP